MLGVLSAPQIEDLLRSELVGRIGCHADGRTYVVPVTYAYDGECVYAHSAEGLKVHLMRQNPEVCFEVDRMDDLANWRSVIASGTYEELSGDAASEGLMKLVQRVMPLMTSETATPSHGLGGSERPSHAADVGPRTPVIFRLRLLDKTGRFEQRP